ncbi:MAG: AAA family ATPase [Caldilineaceae bacterium]|nr:AAA family ATPase [Caldilineaceae bacterium]
MTISKIRIANFKSFADLTVELNDFNLLVGANASGKSNFVQAFQFLRDIAAQGLEDAISLQGGVEYLRNIKIGDTQPLIFHVAVEADAIWSSSEGRRYRIHSFDYEFRLQFDKKGRGYTVVRDRVILTYWREDLTPEDTRQPAITAEQRAKYAAESTVEFKSADGRLEILSTSPESEPLFSPDEIGFLTSTVNRSLSKKSLLLESPFAHFFAESIWDWVREIGVYDFDPRKAKRVVPVAGRSELETDGSNLAIVLRNLLSDESVKRSVRNLCWDNLPYVKSLGVEQVADRFIFFTLREEFADDKDLPASLISDGTANIIALVVALFFQKQKRFAIFEEPERHLHPKVISGLMELFKDVSEWRQLLAATHNPGMVKHAGLENILLISRDKNGFSRITKPADSEHVKIFLENDLGVEDLFTDNLLGV